MSYVIDARAAKELRLLGETLLDIDQWYEKQQYEELLVYRYHDAFYKMLELMRGIEFIYDFDWMAYGKTAESFISDEKKLAKADLESLRKLFTAHSRNEALIDGHMAEMIDSGHFYSLVARLLQLI